MKTHPKYRRLTALAALLLILTLLVPVWSIRLTAPQYPDGMGMYIHMHGIVGHDINDIQNINILNHYIGMREITQHAIPDFKYIPYIAVVLSIIGFGSAALGRRWMMTSWLILFILLGIVGMVDFYRWTIEYGHNLDPTAPIKVPGMTYTPPMLGVKTLLNITAKAYPHVGGYLLFAAIGLSGWAVVGSYRNPEAHSRKAMKTTSASVVAIIMVFMVAGFGCNKQDYEVPKGSLVDYDQHMVYGESEDPYCGSLVEKTRWGGEIHLSNGDRLQFKSTECLVAWLLTENPTDVSRIFVVDFPGTTGLIEATSATYLHTPNLKSPSGIGLMAISTERMQFNLQSVYSGQLIDWEEVQEVVRDSWHLDHSPN